MRVAALVSGATLAVQICAAPARAQGLSADDVAQLRRLMEQQAATLRQQQAELARMRARLTQLEAQNRAAAPRPGAARMASSAPAGAGVADPATTPQTVEQEPGGGGRPPGAPQQRGAAGRSGATTPAIVPNSTPVTPTANPQAVDQGPATPGAPQDVAQPPVSTPAQGQPALPVLSGNDRIKITVSGQVSRSLIFHGDGSGKVDTYFADNNISSTRIRLLGAAAIDAATSVVSALEFDLRSNTSAVVGRETSNNNGGDTPVIGPFRVRRAEIGVQSDAYGTVLFGRGSTFSDGIAQLDFSGTDVVIYSRPSDSYGGLRFANADRPFRRAADPSVADVFSDMDGSRDDRLRYDTPSLYGLTFGASVGQGLFWDAGARYSAEINGAKLAAGVAYQNLRGTLPGNNPFDGDVPPTQPYAQAVSGSFAVLLPNGLNASFSGGWGQHRKDCCGGGLVANDDIKNWFVKVGYQARIFGVAKTNVSVDAGQTFNFTRDGDIATRVGIQVNQPIISEAVELYGAYERLMLRRTGASFKDSDVGILGSRVRF